MNNEKFAHTYLQTYMLSLAKQKGLRQHALNMWTCYIFTSTS